MTLQELCETLNVSEITVKKNFVRLQKSCAKKNLILTREGRGKTANYNVVFNIPNKER